MKNVSFSLALLSNCFISHEKSKHVEEKLRVKCIEKVFDCLESFACFRLAPSIARITLKTATCSLLLITLALQIRYLCFYTQKPPTCFGEVWMWVLFSRVLVSIASKLRLIHHRFGPSAGRSCLSYSGVWVNL